MIELNLETIRRLREEGVPAVCGDATHRETLKEAAGGPSRRSWS
ncbi:MAG: NAD-binding protein [Gemmataceae bacterium]